MKRSKQRKLEKAGWRIGSASEFLELTPEEAEYVEMKVALAMLLKENRSKRRLTQAALAGLIGSSQSRVAKMEAGDPTVSVDLLIKALIALGTSRKDVAKAIVS